VVGLLFSPAMAQAESLEVARGDTAADGGEARRLQQSLGISYRSNWFLLGGLRLSKRLGDARNEVAAQWGSAVVTGCGIQAPECVQGAAYTLGVRRYFRTGLFSPYAGSNLHYLVDGFRRRQMESLIVDADLGFHWQTLGGWAYGFGWTVFFYDRPGSDFSPATQGWLNTEIGWAF
tara:strand:- start:395 stop:922 length:528 start_codon:yes stop_codon:yes gene_type:complete